jgi:hypothetical protein
VTYAIAVQNELSVSEFTVVMEDDGSSISDDVLGGIIEEGERVGCLMVLAPAETWSSAGNIALSHHFHIHVCGVLVLLHFHALHQRWA